MRFVPVMLLHVADHGILSDEEAVDAAVLGVLSAAVRDAAARDDRDVAVLAHVEIIVDQLLEPGLADDDRDMDALPLCTGFDIDVDAGLVGLRLDLYVGGIAPRDAFSVAPDIVGAHRQRVQLRDFLQKILLDLSQLYHVSTYLLPQPPSPRSFSLFPFLPPWTSARNMQCR